MPNKNYPKEILTIIRSNPAPAELKEKLSDYHENDLADALTALTPERCRFDGGAGWTGAAGAAGAAGPAVFPAFSNWKPPTRSLSICA